MDEKEFIIPSGDTLQEQESDWKLKDFGEVLEIIKAMPTLDKQVFNSSQYENVEHLTACTMYCGINGLSSIENKEFSLDDRNDIIKLGQANGWRPGYGWMRALGVDTVRKWWNEKYPDNKIITFVVEYGSEEFNLVMEKLGIVMGSISVDENYWKDVRDNLIIDGDKYDMKTGHATCFMNMGEYICVDSIPKSIRKDNVKNAMVYRLGDNFDKLIETGNIKKDFHIFIFEKWLQTSMSVEEKTRLESFRSELEKAIAANSAIWNLTTQEDEKKERNRMNNYNRAKLKVIESMLK